MALFDWIAIALDVNEEQLQVLAGDDNLFKCELHGMHDITAQDIEDARIAALNRAEAEHPKPYQTNFAPNPAGKQMRKRQKLNYKDPSTDEEREDIELAESEQDGDVDNKMDDNNDDDMEILQDTPTVKVLRKKRPRKKAAKKVTKRPVKKRDDDDEYIPTQQAPKKVTKRPVKKRVTKKAIKKRPTKKAPKKKKKEPKPLEVVIDDCGDGQGPVYKHIARS